jgi:hypothetical protein
MATAKSHIIHKHFRLDSTKLKRAQKVLDATTETETVERALDLAISEHERSRLATEANLRFIRSGVVIRDVFGVLEE